MLVSQHVEVVDWNAPKGRFLQILLVAYDFSEPAEAALRYAIDLADIFRSLVALVYVQSAMEIASEMESGRGMEGESRHEIQNDIDLLRRRLTAERVEHRIIHRAGVVADILTEIAAELHADLVLLGAYGSKKLDPPRLGSTAEFLIDALSCGVMVVGPEALLKQRKALPLKTILYVISGLHEARSTTFATLLAFGTSSTIEVATELDPGVSFFRPRARLQIESEGDAVAEQLRSAGILVNRKQLYGCPSEVIADRAREIHADLILFDHDVASEESQKKSDLVSGAI